MDFGDLETKISENPGIGFPLLLIRAITLESKDQKFQ